MTANSATSSRTGLPVVRLAPAKLNLTLAVLGRRPDGFHDLHSIVVPLGLADRLSLAGSGGPRDTLHVDGFAAGPSEDNLVLRAIEAARREIQRRHAGFAELGGGPVAGSGAGSGAEPLAARLEKRIPVAAGLGGGSSDAAAALDAALEAWDEELEPEVRLALARRLGSDVPFFLGSAGAPALIEGRGEHVTPLQPIGPGPDGPPGVLLVTPAVEVRTPEVYAALDAGARPTPGAGARAASQHLAAELQRTIGAAALVDRAAVLASANDLVPATRALVPDLVAASRSLSRLLRRPVGQSGSGPTLWVLYASLALAREAAATAADAHGRGVLAMPGGVPTIVATTIGAPAAEWTTGREAVSG